MSERVRVLLLSDLHFGRVPNCGFKDLGSLSWDYVKASFQQSHDTDVTEGLLAIAPTLGPVDLLVLAGDQGATGHPDDQGVAAAWLGRLLPALGKPPVLAIPGNHDRMTAYLSPGPVPAIVPLNAGPLVVGGVTFVGADFTLQSTGDAVPAHWPPAWMGQGKFRPAAVPPAPVGPTVWVVHYPPLYPGVDPNLDLHGGGALVASAVAQGVSLLLAGHTHAFRDYVARAGADRVRVICNGTSAATGEAQVFTVIDVAAVGAGVRATPQRWGWVPEAGGWTDVTSR